MYMVLQGARAEVIHTCKGKLGGCQACLCGVPLRVACFGFILHRILHLFGLRAQQSLQLPSPDLLAGNVVSVMGPRQLQ